MAWNTPKTWVSEETVYASDINSQLRDNMLLTEAAVAETQGTMFTQNSDSDRMKANTFYSATADIPNVTYTAESDGDYIGEGPFLEVPRALSYLVFYGARQYRVSGSGRVFFAPWIKDVLRPTVHNMYSTSAGAYRDSGYRLFDASLIPSLMPDLEGDTFTFGMVYGATTAGTKGQWAQRTITVLPLG